MKTDYGETSRLTAFAVGAGLANVRVKKTGAVFTPEFTHFDHQGSAVAATDAAGASLWTERYGAFGTERQNPAANDNDTAYTGHLKDDATGLTYMQARLYDPQIGRFYSTDPIGYDDQLNLYAYVHNDPVNATDPNGEFIVLLANPFVRGAIAGAVGGAVATAVNAGAQAIRNNGQVNWGDALSAGVAAGAASAAIAANPALAANPAALSAIGAAAGVSGSVGGDVVNGRDINVTNAAVAGIAGAVGVPGGAKVGDLVENALGAAASSVAGETAGAIGGEVVAGAVNAALPEAAGALRQAGSAVADGARAVGGAVHQGVQELQNMNQGPSCAHEENGC